MLAYGWKVGRKHDRFHTRRLHDALIKDPDIRVGPNWLSFGISRAVRDISGYNSSICNKVAIYASLQGGGKHLVNMTNRLEHPHRWSLFAMALTMLIRGANIVDSVIRLLKQMNALCTMPLSLKESTPKKEDLKFDGVTWSFWFTFEAVAKIGLSKDLHFTETGDGLFSIRCADGKTKPIRFRDSLHGGSRTASTLVWDTEWLPFLKRVTCALFDQIQRELAAWRRWEDNSDTAMQRANGTI